MLTVSQHLKSLKDLELDCFSGEFQVCNSTNQKWTFYLLQGQIIYATGGLHPVRRWRRQLIAFCPHLPTYRLAWQIDLANIEDAKLTFGWEYALLKYWVTQKKISLRQAQRIIRSMVEEILFELSQESDLSYKVEPNHALGEYLEVIHISSIVEIIEQQWKEWQSIGLEEYSPNQALVLNQVHQPWQVESKPEWKPIIERLKGQDTFYDLAAETQRSLIDIATFLAPLIHSEWIELIHISDLPAPIYRQRLFNRPIPPSPVDTPHKGGLIACIDDSSFVRNMVEQVVSSAGYQFIGIEDPMRAIGILLARKPDLIFLDLVMPQIGGHELCEQLRKLTYFKTTPIIVLTGNDGYVNRLRSNFAGASDFLTKPLDAKVMLGAIHKYLTQDIVVSQV